MKKSSSRRIYRRERERLVKALIENSMNSLWSYPFGRTFALKREEHKVL